MTINVDPDWWKTIFDEVYLVTDARSVCDDEVTQVEVDLIVRLLPVSRHHRILDLCGGHGRHTLELRARGIGRCVLLDYSRALLDHARSLGAASRLHVDCVLADARNTGLLSESFDHVLIMGNSLGYLPDADADRDILQECFRLLRPGGWAMIDLTDGEVVRKRFNARAWHEIGPDVLVCREREMGHDTISVREVVMSKSKGLIRDSSYRIRFYDAERIQGLLSLAGFSDIQVIRDFSPHPTRGDYGCMNHRMIAIGRKA